jgi:hypothetical protein
LDCVCETRTVRIKDVRSWLRPWVGGSNTFYSDKYLRSHCTVHLPIRSQAFREIVQLGADYNCMIRRTGSSTDSLPNCWFESFVFVATVSRRAAKEVARGTAFCAVCERRGARASDLALDVATPSCPCVTLWQHAVEASLSALRRTDGICFSSHPPYTENKGSILGSGHWDSERGTRGLQCCAFRPTTCTCPKRSGDPDRKSDRKSAANPLVLGPTKHTLCVRVEFRTTLCYDRWTVFVKQERSE